MRIFICCSKHIYDRIPPIFDKLTSAGHLVTLPNSYDDPGMEEKMRALSEEEHRKWKAEMIRLQEEKVRGVDAILVLNMEKHGIDNYIGGATFLEMFKAFELGRPIYLWNPIPENILRDEIQGFGVKVINGDLSLIS
ncbi:MAG: hypothetical protein PHG66_06700 [Candidatus Colwellbacteria bacterium]|nr:hypothetical protein [Candidatus Colwellbacteria bacterium]